MNELLNIAKEIFVILGAESRIDEIIVVKKPQDNRISYRLYDSDDKVFNPIYDRNINKVLVEKYSHLIYFIDRGPDNDFYGVSLRIKSTLTNIQGTY